MDGNSDQNTPTQEVNKRGKIPHWMKNVDPTQDLVLRYQVKTKELQDTLQADLRVLREISQVQIFAIFLMKINNPPKKKRILYKLNNQYCFYSLAW